MAVKLGRNAPGSHDVLGTGEALSEQREGPWRAGGQIDLRLRDVFCSVDPATTQGQFEVCAVELDRFTALVYQAVGLS